MKLSHKSNYQGVEMNPIELVAAWRTLFMVNGFFHLGSRFGSAVRFLGLTQESICRAEYSNEQGEDCWLRHDYDHIVLCGSLSAWKTPADGLAFAQHARSGAREKELRKSLLPSVLEAPYGLSFALYAPLLGGAWKPLTQKRGSEVSPSLLTSLSALRGPSDHLDQWLRDEFEFKNALKAAKALILVSPLTESIVKQFSRGEHISDAIKLAMDAGYPLDPKLLAKTR